MVVCIILVREYQFTNNINCHKHFQVFDVISVEDATDSEHKLRINVSWHLLLKFKYIFVNHEFFIIFNNVLVYSHPQKKAFILLSTIVQPPLHYKEQC